MLQELDTFLAGWEDNSLQVKKSFVRLTDHIKDKGDLSFDFKARPGVSYSLRVRDRLQKTRELFVIMDVIDDDPENRWLSVCFYPDMITDPEEKGVLIPLGLLGEDGYCFDLEEWDENYLQYLKTRLDEAREKASKQLA
ncbi:MAG: hypothetical protein JSV47_03375 [Deltaproteobacteria bacterium]|nr:MAG: hypothetical protein JSV47_03375 [Deltaproteobacteria bacterium]